MKIVDKSITPTSCPWQNIFLGERRSYWSSLDCTFLTYRTRGRGASANNGQDFCYWSGRYFEWWKRHLPESQQFQTTTGYWATRQWIFPLDEKPLENQQIGSASRFQHVRQHFTILVVYVPGFLCDYISLLVHTIGRRLRDDSACVAIRVELIPAS